MKFAPEYVAYVLNENFEDAKELLLVAADGDSLRPPRDARTRRASCPRPTRTRCATRSTAMSQDEIRRVSYDGTYEDLFFYVERLIVAACGDEVAGPAAHGALAQRHRHDDVPDAAARVHPRPAGGDASRCAARCSTSPTRHRDTIFAVHTHTQRGAADDGRALPAGGRRTAGARRDRG